MEGRQLAGEEFPLSLLRFLFFPFPARMAASISDETVTENAGGFRGERSRELRGTCSHLEFHPSWDLRDGRDPELCLQPELEHLHCN